MTSPVDIESLLQQLGNDWPREDSLVEGVMRGLETVPLPPAATMTRWGVARRTLAIAASLAAIVALWTLSKGNTSLYAQVRDAVQRARTFQMITTAPAEGDRPEQRFAVSYERGVGFCEEQHNELVIGNSDGLWRYSKPSKLAVRSKSTGVAEMIDRVLDNEVGQALKGGKHERYAAGDRAVEGRPCKAYLMTKVDGPLDTELKAGRQRMILLLDEQSRVTRVIMEARSGDRWLTRVSSDWKYDVPLDRSLFTPSFPADVRVVDADVAFEHYVDLDKAVYREERRGLWYAVHHAERIAGGGLYLVSSVRGTEATLKKYPLTHRRLQPGLVFVDGPATNYRGSQEYRVPGNIVELASVDHQGINVRWWVLIPMAGAGGNPFETTPGKVKVPAGISPTGGEYGNANFKDANGVMQYLTWDIELAVPQPETLPTLDAIARQVYGDLSNLEGVPFKFLNLGSRGMTVPYWSDLNKISATRFSQAVQEDVQWWKDGGPVDDPRFLELRKNPFPPQ